jgi:hypothetical protein
MWASKTIDVQKIPFIEILNCVPSSCMKYSQQMGKFGLPSAKLKLVKLIDKEHVKHVEPMFCKSLWKCRLELYISKINVECVALLTRIGTYEALSRIALTRLPLTGTPSLKIKVRASSMLRCRRKSSRHLWVTRFFMSSFMPILRTSTFLTRQRGQGHPPRNFIVASRTLHSAKHVNASCLTDHAQNEILTFQDSPLNMKKNAETLFAWSHQSTGSLFHVHMLP